MTQPQAQKEEPANVPVSGFGNLKLASGTSGQTMFSCSAVCGRIQSITREVWTTFPVLLLIFSLLYWVYGSLLGLCLMLLAVIGFLYNAQDRLLYYPDQPPTSRLYVERPSAYKLPYENVYVHTKDKVKINLVFIRQPPGVASVAPTIVFLHGNAGNIGHRLVNALGLYTTGSNVLLVEYRGYGKSDGSPHEHGLYSDSEAAVDYLLKRRDVNHQRIFIFGRSLGGAVAIHLASQPYYSTVIVGLILENTFTTLPEIGRQIFKISLMKLIPEWCFKNKFRSKNLIQKVTSPTLFLSGMSDTLIPPIMMQQLYTKSCSMNKKLARFEAGTHNETWQCPGYYETIAQFISQTIAQSQREKTNGAADVILDQM